jgi:sec-independent protein translocase protein TatA
MYYKSPTTDLIILLVVVLLIFGPKRLPQLGRQLGHGMREFKDGITGRSKDSEAPEPAEIAQTSASPPEQSPVSGATPVESPPARPAPEPEAAEVAGPERGS